MTRLRRTESGYYVRRVPGTDRWAVVYVDGYHREVLPVATHESREHAQRDCDVLNGKVPA